MSFRIDVPALAPPFQQGPNLQTFYGAIGAQLDANALQVLNGRLAANPYAGATPAFLADGRRIECEPYALAVHAHDRAIPLYPTEGLLSQRQRLAAWLTLRRRKGTHLGELQHLRPYFADSVATGFAYPVMRIVHQDGAGVAYWHTMSSGGVYSVQRATNFNYDGQTTKRSRFWLFVEMQGTGYAAPGTYDSGQVFDTTLYYDGAFSAARGTDIVQMALDWKSAHSWLGGVILVWNTTIDVTAAPAQDGTGWWSLPNGTWGSIIAADNRPTRPPYMSWILDNPSP